MLQEKTSISNLYDKSQKISGSGWAGEGVIVVDCSKQEELKDKRDLVDLMRQPFVKLIPV